MGKVVGKHLPDMPILWLVSDLLVIGLSTLIAMKLRQTIPIFPDEGRDVEALVKPLALLLTGLWLVFIWAMGGYSAVMAGTGTTEYKRVTHASFFAAGSVGVVAYLFQYPFSRGFFALYFTIGLLLLLASRFAHRRVLHQLRRNGRLTIATLIAGDAQHAADLVAVLTREPWLGYRPVGLLIRGAPPVNDIGLPVLGRPRDAVHAIEASGASCIVFGEGSFPKATDFNKLAVELEDVDAHTIVVPALADISPARMVIHPVAGIPLVHVDRPQARRASSVGKRVFDLAGTLLLLLVSSPLMAIAAVAIKLDDGGPVLFKQARVGLKGEEFNCLKLRTMVVDAEAQVAALAAANESDGPLFKISRDPRVTRVGYWLRRFSIDEMPQFLNVLRGEMSLIGPRPALPSEVNEYEEHILRRLDVRPGITGLWQVSGRSDLTWDETVRLDLYYVNNWSMLQDLSILARTAGAVLQQRGAY